MRCWPPRNCKQTGVSKLQIPVPFHLGDSGKGSPKGRAMLLNEQHGAQVSLHRPSPLISWLCNQLVELDYSVRTFRLRPLLTRRINLIFLFLAILLAGYSIGSNVSYAQTRRPPQQCRANVGKWSPLRPTLLRNGTALEKPSGIKIVGVIFYGRRQFVDILDCYLRRNLASNGGFLDEVQFLVHSTDPADEKWLHNIVEQNKKLLKDDFKIIKDPEIEKLEKYRGFPELWGKYMTDPDTIYIKIDDDIVFIDDAAIPRLVYSLLAHPEAHSVQANVVNNMRTHWYHFRSGALYPYLPDTSGEAPCCNSTWRASELPCYSGKVPDDFSKYAKGYKPPFANHRWLPLEISASNLLRTPLGAPLPLPELSTYSKNAITWTTEAQIHYSFFQNLENNLLSRYDFGNDEGLWNLWYEKYNINFMAIRGSTVNLRPIWGKHYRDDWKDELGLTQKVPQELEMPAFVDTRAMVSHFSFKFYKHNLLKTDVLARYRAYANEMICGRDNQKKTFGKHVEEGGVEPAPHEDDS